MRHENEHRDIMAFYAKQARIYDVTRAVCLPDRLSPILMSAVNNAQRIADIGCGTGSTVIRFSAKAGPDSCIYAVDPSPEMLHRTKQRLISTARSNVVIVCSMAETLCFTECFDLVILSYSLSMIPDIDLAIQEVRRILKPGGTVAVVDFLPPKQSFPRFYLGILLEWWFNRCHCKASRDLPTRLDRLFQRTFFQKRHGGYNFLYLGRK